MKTKHYLKEIIKENHKGNSKSVLINRITELETDKSEVLQEMNKDSQLNDSSISTEDRKTIQDSWDQCLADLTDHIRILNELIAENN